MKLVLEYIGIGVLVLMGQLSAHAQGRVNFESDVRLESTSGVPVSDGNNYLAQLYFGVTADPYRMQPVGSVVLIGSDDQAGRLLSPSPNSRVLNGIPVGSRAFVQVRVWNYNDQFSFDAVRDFGGHLGLSEIVPVTLEESPTGLLPFNQNIQISRVRGNLSGGGNVIFENSGNGVDAPFRDQNGVPLTGEKFSAQIYAGPTPDFMNPVDGIRHFGSGQSAGYLAGPSRLVQAHLVHPGQETYLKIFVWESAGGKSYEEAVQSGFQFGKSNVVKVIAGGGFFPTEPDPPLVGLQSVQLTKIIPRPLEGTLYFSNHFFDVDSGKHGYIPIKLPNGGHVSGSQFKVQILAGIDPFSLEVIGWPESFLTGDLEGLWYPRAVNVPGTNPGDQVFVKIEVWDSSKATSMADADENLTLRGHSNIFTVKTGGYGFPPTLPAPLTGLEAFSLFKGSKPVILQEPQSISVVAGAPIELRVQFEASPPFLVKWYKDGSQIASGTSGTLRYEIGSIENSGRYFAEISNEAGAIRTPEVSVSVSPRIDPPEIISLTGNKEIPSGGTLILDLKFTGTSPVTIDWYRNGTLFIPNGPRNLTINGLSSDFQGEYSATIKNSAGEATRSFGPVIVYHPLSWQAEPAGGLVVSGSLIHLKSMASGTGPISYQWSLNATSIPGAASSEFQLENATEENSGSYTVSATSPYGTIRSKAAIIDVMAPPLITAHPQGGKASVNKPIKLTVSADGRQPISYQWTKNGTPIAGSQSEVLSIANPTGNDAGSYAVIVSNPAGEVVSQPAIIHFGDAPAITRLSSPASISKNHGLLVWVEASGESSLEYIWNWNGIAIDQTKNRWTFIQGLNPDNPGSISVTVKNDAGSTESEPFEFFRVLSENFEFGQSGSVTRNLPLILNDSSPFQVNLLVSGESGKKIRVVEILPPNTRVVEIADGGSYDPRVHRITWDLPTSRQLILSYVLEPVGEVTAGLEFSGHAQFNGNQILTDGAGSVGGVPVFPADSNPFDFTISEEELNTYLDSFLLGDLWEGNRIPLSYAVRAMSLHLAGQPYQYVPSLADPVAWIPTDNQIPNKVPKDLAGTVHFIGQSSPGKTTLQVVIDVPASNGLSSGLELQLSDGWSWDDEDHDRSTGRWIFPNTNARKIVANIFRNPGSKDPSLSLEGHVSHDGYQFPLASTTSIDDPQASSIQSASRNGDTFTLKGSVAFGGSWVIESTSDFIKWSPWITLPISQGTFEFSGQIEDVRQKFFRLRFQQ